MLLEQLFLEQLLLEHNLGLKSHKSLATPLVHTHIHTGQSRNGRTGLDEVFMDEVPVEPVSNAIPLVF